MGWNIGVLTLPAAQTHLSNSDKALRIFLPLLFQNACRIPLVSVDQSPALALSLPAGGLPESVVFRQESFLVMPLWAVGAGTVGAGVMVAVNENGWIHYTG